MLKRYVGVLESGEDASKLLSSKETGLAYDDQGKVFVWNDQEHSVSNIMEKATSEAVEEITETLQENYYTKEETDEKIASIDKEVFLVVTALPTDPAEVNEHKIYLLPKEKSSTNNKYYEYKGTVNGDSIEWELLGEMEADLSNYYNKEEVDEKVGAVTITVNSLDEKVTDLDTKFENYYTKDEINDISGSIEVSITEVRKVAISGSTALQPEDIVDNLESMASDKPISARAVNEDVINYIDQSISDTMLYINQQDQSEHAGRVAGDNLLSERIASLESKDSVEWDHTLSEAPRKHIVLENHDSILGRATNNVAHNLAMVSKWNVADFGAAGLHMNLNSKDGEVTINDDRKVATENWVEEQNYFKGLGVVDDPDDPGKGFPYHIPYNVIPVPGTDKMTLTIKTITVDNDKIKWDNTMELPAATVDYAGLMSAADKRKLDMFDSLLARIEALENKSV